MRGYLHFLLALLAGFLAAGIGALPGTIPMAMPGTEPYRISMDMVALGAVPGSALGAVAFWLVGRRPPLRATLARTALGALVTLAVFLILIKIAAQTVWLTDGGAQLAVLALVVTLGYLPFRPPRSIP